MMRVAAYIPGVYTNDMTNETITTCWNCRTRPAVTATRCQECADSARAEKEARVKDLIAAREAQTAQRRQLAREGWFTARAMGA